MSETRRVTVNDIDKDERVWLLMDTGTGAALQRNLRPRDELDPSKGYFKAYAGFRTREDAKQCLKTIPEGVRKAHQPVSRPLGEALANAVADGSECVGVAIFSGDGKRITRIITGV